MTIVVVAALLFGAPDAQTREAISAAQYNVAQERLLKKRSSGVWDMDDQLTLAAVCLGKGDLPCAEFLYQETLKPQPRTALAYFGLGEVARKNGDLARAQQFYAAYLASDLPGRSAAFDQLAHQRVQAIAAAGARTVTRPVGRRVRPNPPSFGRLSWSASRWAAISFFPAVFGGLITGALVDEMNIGRDGFVPMVSALGVGGAIFGGGIAWGINRTAVRHGYTGAVIQAGISAVATPLVVGASGALMMDMSNLDDDLVGPLMLFAVAAGVSFVPAWVYMTDLRPIGAEAGTGNAEGGVPSVVGR